METSKNARFDVVILGAGLAGLSLARQLTLMSGKSILLLEKRPQIPPPRQKVGEATVQLSGYYFSKVLDLEEHLLRKHLLKYNLRFYYKTPGRANDAYEDYSQSYIRNLSNIASYQLDRNKIEGELLKLNRESANFSFHAGIFDLSVLLSDTGPHIVQFEEGGRKNQVETTWVVDTTGRSKFLSRRMGLATRNPIRHGASFFWVDGLLNIERLTSRSLTQVRLNKHRCMTGHFPVWLATNHFVGEGFWFWVIPLHGKTSVGLVYDREKIPGDQVNTLEKLIAWVCREFPLFARDLKGRKILDHGVYRDLAYDCSQTVSDSSWAMSGESGRFSDPLYSPGGDLIALHNTLIADSILTDDARLLKTKVRVYDALMHALYQAYVPSYAVSYEVLGDQECFALKYAWELTVYFTFFVFPFINDLFTDLKFVTAYLREFAKLGALNRNLQMFITSYYQWKKLYRKLPAEPRFFDFMDVGPLRNSEKLFYKVGLTPQDAIGVLAHETRNLNEFANFIVAHIYSVVAEDATLLTNRQFVESLDLNAIEFNPELMREQAKRQQFAGEKFHWSFDPRCLAHLQDAPNSETEMAAAPEIEKENARDHYVLDMLVGAPRNDA